MRSLILALLLVALPGITPPARAGEAASAADLSENAYHHDVARAARLSVEEAELTLKHDAGKISTTRFNTQVARVRAASQALTDKWEGGVNRRAAVMFTGDVFARSASEISALKRRYGVAPKPSPAPAPPSSAPPYDPYIATLPDPPSDAAEGIFHNIGWIFLASMILCISVGTLSVLWRRWFPKGEEEGPTEPETSGNYGTASFAPIRYGPPNRAYVSRGVFFGKSSDPAADSMPVLDQPGAPICSLPANHTLIVARTRTGKGTRVIVPTLLRYMGSAIVIDPKGENAAITARARMNVVPGFESPVHILNPWGELRETFKGLGFKFDRLNPLDVIDRTNPNAVAIAQTMAATICPKTGGRDDYWQGSAANILAAVFLYLADQPGETKTLARVREITSLSRKDFTAQFMVKMAASSGFGGAIRELIGPYVDLANDTYSGIISNLSEAMKFASDPQLKASTEFTSFDLAEFGAPVTVYIIIPPDKMETQRTWLRLVIAMLTDIHKLKKMSERANKHRTLFLIDEFPALGRMQDMPSNLATMAGYGIDYALVVQGLDQLKATYKESAGTILSNCAFKWFCNISDLDTAKYLSETLGKATVQTIGKSESSGFNPGGESTGASTNYGETGRALLTVDEVMTLGRDKAIVLHPDSKPHYVRPIDYWNLSQAFARMQPEFPEMYWTPPLRFDDNPYHDGGA